MTALGLLSLRHRSVSIAFFGRNGEPMTTAKASAEASAAENGERSTTVRKVPAEAAPTVHAVPVEHTEKPGKPVNVKSLPVRPGEEPWTRAELKEVQDALTEDIARFESQIEVSTAELVGLLRDGSEGAGRDPADVGSANFERDAEMSLANNAREMLDQSRLALRHIELGTYGSCDNCGQPIGKGRLQAFPRATLCVTCKQREERR
jgi:DnaK suppressor protein